MFKTRNSTPLAMNNLLNDQIRPALDRCVCGLEKIELGGADHDYTRDKARPEWHSLHAFRCGLATNLHGIGVDDLTISAHSQAQQRRGDAAVLHQDMGRAEHRGNGPDERPG